MRNISAQSIQEAVARMCIQANTVLPSDVRQCLIRCRQQEDWPPAAEVLDDIIQNYKIAERRRSPICQDTGMACIFIEIGQEVHVAGDINEAIQNGVGQGYTEGALRKSVVRDPLRRENTGDNTPAMISYTLIPGDRLKITVAPKGFGSENMSRLAMLTPADGREGIKAFVLETVEKAGPNPCPPIIVGIGIGGTFDKVALLAKQALLRETDKSSPDPYYAALEQELLEAVNRSGIGPQGFGGRTTALAVHIETAATHIGALPVAVNLNCHVARHVSEVL